MQIRLKGNKILAIRFVQDPETKRNKSKTIVSKYLSERTVTKEERELLTKEEAAQLREFLKKHHEERDERLVGWNSREFKRELQRYLKKLDNPNELDSFSDAWKEGLLDDLDAIKKALSAKHNIKRRRKSKTD